jgi:reactive chlorine resistance protein C
MKLLAGSGITGSKLKTVVRVRGDAMHMSIDQLIAESYRSARAQVKLEALGLSISRYGLAVILLLIGSLKFTAGEAAAIQPLVAHSPLLSWTYAILSVQEVSNVIGVIEIAIAVLLVLRPVSAKASFIGSLGSIVTFLLTISFLFSTPGAIQWNHGLPVLGDAGQFLIKDVVLLGASFWTAAEALGDA